jgi:hypothetical protein
MVDATLRLAVAGMVLVPMLRRLLLLGVVYAEALPTARMAHAVAVIFTIVEYLLGNIRKQRVDDDGYNVKKQGRM